MSKVRSKNTTPETTLRKALFNKGFRYRTNDDKLPGKPDIVLHKYRTAIFVHGCFWHGHQGCKKSTLPKTNADFWFGKIESNKRRDRLDALQLLSMGWKVLTVWECEINKRNMNALVDRIIESLHEEVPYRSGSVSVKLYEERESVITMVAEEAVQYQKQSTSIKN